MRKTVLVTGGTGFIGKRLCQELLKNQFSLIILTRNPKGRDSSSAEKVEYIKSLDEIAEERSISVMINLAGASIAGGRWTNKRQEKILNSRLHSTQNLVALCKRLQSRPELLISGSAIGYYGFCEDETLTESAGPKSDFLSEVCQKWEGAALEAETLGVRVCILRTGLVLGKEGGALAKMLPAFRLGLGGPIGNGKQWISWIHLEDEVRLILFLMANSSMQGPVNATAPQPVINADLSLLLGKTLRRPAVIPAPDWLLKLLLGKMSLLLLKGQKVWPQKALAAGFSFRFTTLLDALENILRKQ